jgi:hypothetical protein
VNQRFSYYDILGLPEQATPEEIKTAYRSAMLKYHPDVNTAPNAAQITQMLNEAYSTLSDSTKRRAYDQSIATGTSYASDPQAASEPVWPLYSCDGCGAVTPYLRFAMFFYVFSVLIYTHAQPSGGVLCPSCRSARAWRAALFSTLLGPWSFVIWWSFYYTGRALLAAVRGREQPAAPNSALLRHQGIAFLQRDYLSEAKTALLDSLYFEPHYAAQESGPAAATRGLLNEPLFQGVATGKSPRFLKGQAAALIFSALAPLLVIVVLSWMGFLGSAETTGGGAPPIGTQQGAEQATNPYAQGYYNEAPPIGTQQGAEQAQLQQLLKTCTSQVEHEAPSKAQGAIRACNSAISWLEDYMKAAIPETESYQEISGAIDSARIWKGVALMELGQPQAARAVGSEGVQGLQWLKDAGVTSAVRHYAARACGSLCR